MKQSISNFDYCLFNRILQLSKSPSISGTQMGTCAVFVEAE